MSPTVAELREEIQDSAGVHEGRRNESSLSSYALKEIAKAIGCEQTWGGSPSLRKQIREKLTERKTDDWIDASTSDAKPLRKDELVDVRDAIEAEQGGESQ